MQNIVSFREPKFKPLPGELTPAVINGATLPVKVEAAKRAIAACCDLSELLTWKDKLAALAAAAKMARMPEMARDVNRVHKEAIFRMGEILLQYNGSSTRDPVFKGGSNNSERSKVAKTVGISPSVRSSAIRLASAPSTVKDRILSDDKIPSRAAEMARFSPPIRKGGRRYEKFSDKARRFFSGVNEFGKRNGGGLNIMACELRNFDLSLTDALTPEEKQRAKKLIVEMQEILDEMDRRLDTPT